MRRTWLLVAGSIALSVAPLVGTPRAARADEDGDGGAQPAAPAAAAPAKPRKRHPFAAALPLLRRMAQFRVVQTLRDVAEAEAMCEATGLLDADGDGAGEYVGFQDLTDVFPHPGVTRRPFDRAFAGVDDAGEVVVRGYVFRISLPDSDGLPVHETRLMRALRVGTDLAEKSWCLYAWPLDYGRTGRFTYFTDQSGEVLATDAPEYGGRGHGPAPDAAYAADDDTPGILGATAADGKARDRHAWRDASTLRGDEILPAAVPVRADAWRDQATVDRLLGAACDEVEAVLGGPWPGGRPRARIVEFADVDDAVRADIGPVHERIGLPAAQREQSIAMAAPSLVAKYDLRSHDVLVCPETAEVLAQFVDAPWITTEDALRSFLVHEAVHAHDFPAHGFARSLGAVDTVDALTAWSAVVEGHAQSVAERISEAHGRGDDFRRMTDSITAVPDIGSPEVQATLRAAVASVSFPYVEGHRFMRAIAAGGGDAAVARALDAPPATSREIERPEIWLAGGEAPPAVPSSAILDRFAKLVPAGWPVTRVPVVRAVLRSQAESFGIADAEDAIRGVSEMQAVVAARSQTSQLLVCAIRTDGERSAAAVVEFERRLSAAREAASNGGDEAADTREVTEGAGPGGSLPGFVATKRLRVGATVQELVLHVARLGSCVIELTVVAAPVARADIDAALADAAELLAEGDAPATK